jgi:hypothetical protein
MILVLVGACALSAAAGSGATLLLAERGLTGPRGEQGVEGPPGDSAIDAGYEAAEALDRVEDLEGTVSGLESDVRSAFSSTATVDEVINLESQIAEAQGDATALCRALDLIC